MRPATGKILCHFNGMGSPNVGLIRTRAEELARINGHAVYTEADWQQAKHELHGTDRNDDELSEEMGPSTMVSGADMLTTDFGHHTPRLGMEDDGNAIEELWREGMDEAEHERMLAACKEAGKTCEIKVYQDAPHGFNADYRSSYRADAAKDGWQRMLAWFKEHGVG